LGRGLTRGLKRLKRINEVGNNINVVMERLKLPQPVDLEMEFLGEWLDVMHPVATALDKIQGENTANSQFRAILPAVRACKSGSTWTQ